MQKNYDMKDFKFMVIIQLDLKVATIVKRLVTLLLIVINLSLKKKGKNLLLMYVLFQRIYRILVR